MSSSLFEVFVLLAAACAVVPLASSLRLGSVLGYLLAGVVIGPHALGLFTDTADIAHVAEFGVVMMLFLIGLELEPAMLWRLRKAILGAGGLQVLLSTLLLAIVGLMLGFSWQASIAGGMALSLSSTALVLQLLREANLMNTPVGETAFSVLLFQDMAVIPILVLMPLLALPGVVVESVDASFVAQWPGYLRALAVTVVIAGLVVAGKYFSYHVFRAIAKTRLREIFTALSLALIVGITLLMQLVGISPALGAFVAGLVLANSQYRRTLEADIEPFKGLLLGLFFISVGIGIDFSLVADAPLQVVGAVALLIALKAVVMLLVSRWLGLLPVHSAGFALALSQGGEFAFVLFQFAHNVAVISSEQARMLTLIVALSMATTPLLMQWYTRRVVPRFMSALPAPAFDTIDEQHSIILAGFGRFGQVIGRFLIGQGLKVTVLEKDPEQIELLRKFGYKAYFGDASRPEVLRSAGIAKARLLIVAVDEIDASLSIIRYARQEFPELTIFARAHNRQHAFDLHQLGVQQYKREMFESSLALASSIMQWLGQSQEQATLKAAQFREYDEETLNESFRFFEDEPALVSYTKTRRGELERILQSDSYETQPGN